MATYVMSDIHGEYEKFVEILEMIQLTQSDTLYVLGDIIDRGPNPIKVLTKLMSMPNAICIVGNHELMALKCLRFLMQEITESSINEMDDHLVDLLLWQSNGSSNTIDEFRKLDLESRQDAVEFIKDFLVYEEITVADKNYLLVHAGLGNYSPDKTIEEYSLDELVWMRADYDTEYFKDVYVVSGHTPTQIIEGNPKPGFIYRHNNHIAIDCGACFPGGRLAAICLETGEEYYSSSNDMRGTVN